MIRLAGGSADLLETRISDTMSYAAWQTSFQDRPNILFSVNAQIESVSANDGR